MVKKFKYCEVAGVQKRASVYSRCSKENRMFRSRPKTLPPKLRKLEDFERNKQFSTSIIADERVRYFRRILITCNNCGKRSSLRRWIYVCVFKREWYPNIGIGKLKGRGTIEPTTTQHCLLYCPRCGKRQEVGFTLESAYIVLAVDDYNISPRILFASYMTDL